MSALRVYCLIAMDLAWTEAREAELARAGAIILAAPRCSNVIDFVETALIVWF